ncbi:acetyl-CoA carboxylase biotin carboxyl carrier protein subunit [Cellulosilyticum sp. WCF-2]|uniref:acetyl-CoA carboxylase biotin carboxyl carrier protein subunit n=1 Tax=Cellulosilyticum sp. WCF-2 TaxID=2497860 RepID=UPI000F8E6C77|nr:acetyl-CoA carboxylase biotin carboxyl carrier protein subunit [Cellulosilyticum sp. WCF-2]QEH67616.1 acetyl-CoA carboxylase biotin carboxyl carrier protein subunit [Cellulosilyticum sp. WCF-2]
MEYILKAHMPGLVARVVCEIGEKVEAGQELAVINCMKTEMSCVTEKAGTVKEILVAEWDEMDVGSPMIVLDAE